MTTRMALYSIFSPVARVSDSREACLNPRRSRASPLREDGVQRMFPVESIEPPVPLLIPWGEGAELDHRILLEQVPFFGVVLWQLQCPRSLFEILNRVIPLETLRLVAIIVGLITNGVFLRSAV